MYENCIPTICCTALVLGVLAGCSSTATMSQDRGDAEQVSLPQIKPEVDFSNTSPDCETAGKRLRENVPVGTPLAEVERLVGKPAYRFPGSWWWSDNFDRTGKPHVRYNALLKSTQDATVTTVRADTSGC